ncbi:exodeoxyribonuclease V subunit alpha [Acinetobacter sp. B5B]|uniref:exodeoxyribonuclease V subunit alpha n=1 Tax=Acinetobacter baretiae TaxID=2605383 RepID=UPI0018C22340|nr:exodeoxyribonuclease V subunit alpha [Acinetobacter baretiae]MBF7682257.1 exodeoxyribonuclease V subunit alpha [Acinetobacter baretiae]
MNIIKNQDIQAEPWAILWSEYLTQSVSFTDDAERIAAQSLIQAVLFSVSEGHSCLATTASDAKRLRSLVSFSDKSHITPFVFCHDRLYLYRYYALEQRLAQQVKRLNGPALFTVDHRTDLYSQLLTDPYQKKALEVVATHGLSMIIGGPGTGKTYTLARIIAVLSHRVQDLRIAMAAPTGKAAQRMQEALKHAFKDDDLKALMTPALELLQPVTLHRLLKISKQGHSQFNQQQPLPYDVVVVDEASMLDLQLATQLFEAVATGTRLILLGDANQLASVDVGTVLNDLQHSTLLHTQLVELQYSRRFSDDAQIGKMARFIQHQKKNKTQDVVQQFEQEVAQATVLRPIDLSEIKKDYIQLQYINDTIQTSQYLQTLWYGFEHYAEMLKRYCQTEDHVQQELSHEQQAVLAAFDDYRILTAMRYGDFGVTQLNHYMQTQLLEYLAADAIPRGDWYVGRPVMMTENNDQIGLSNGDVGICFKHRKDPTQFEVYFPSLAKWVLATRLPKHIQTAFAMTIHKSQGSEFTHTAVVFANDAEKLLSQELLYTAITRAKKVVTLLVAQTAFASALTHRTVRQSGLIHFLK